jgi:hypothetical protein
MASIGRRAVRKQGKDGGLKCLGDQVKLTSARPRSLVGMPTALQSHDKHLSRSVARNTFRDPVAVQTLPTTGLAPTFADLLLFNRGPVFPMLARDPPIPPVPLLPFRTPPISMSDTMSFGPGPVSPERRDPTSSLPVIGWLLLGRSNPDMCEWHGRMS